jgi:hypothetical protein
MLRGSPLKEGDAERDAAPAERVCPMAREGLGALVAGSQNRWPEPLHAQAITIGPRARAPCSTLAIARRTRLAVKRTPRASNTPATVRSVATFAVAFAMQAGEDREPCHPK